ncbi:MAG: hypothetical protein COA79_25960 [Planctomycetota bacterium]|nr:MAG: hypothetical protein COA79_25960 [Planctomycetota bacterium]
MGRLTLTNTEECPPTEQFIKREMKTKPTEKAIAALKRLWINLKGDLPTYLSFQPIKDRVFVYINIYYGCPRVGFMILRSKPWIELELGLVFVEFIIKHRDRKATKDAKAAEEAWRINKERTEKATRQIYEQYIKNQAVRTPDCGMHDKPGIFRWESKTKKFHVEILESIELRVRDIGTDKITSKTIWFPMEPGPELKKIFHKTF